MNCSKPILINGGAFGCGQCTSCRINRRRVWTHRIMLEAAQFEDNAFVTLTYDEENTPADQSVTPKELTNFIKRLRYEWPGKVRYFACGEYGDSTFRPHYHVALFNFPSCRRGVSHFSKHTGKCCATCDTILKAWGKGQVIIGTLTEQSAAYVAGYVTKKMTKDDDPRLEGRRPEFARMSLRPGIGLGMMHELASTLLEHRLDERMIDVPLALRHGSKQWPLGRYLRRKLRTFIGRDEKAPPEALEKQKAELQTMRETAFALSKPLQKEILDKSKGRRIQLEAREQRQRKKQI